MNLADFDIATVEAGHTYELGRGVIIVTDISNPGHFAQVDEVREQLSAYKRKNRGRIYRIASGGECKVQVERFVSERHPDLAVYVTPPPNDDSSAWSIWIPALVVEIVSYGSADRDYIEKREEYLLFGVQEYWIFDSAKRQLFALRRVRGRWDEVVVRSSRRYKTPLFPGLEFDCGAVFEAK